MVLSDGAFLFLFGWELMSLASWLLLAAAGGEAGRQAARLYLTMAMIGSLALVLAFGILGAATGGFGFQGMRDAGPSADAVGLAVLLAILGAGSKAGLVPLHVWLPPAHAAAPTHVSALMSGVMTKVALYGLMRLLFDLAGPPQLWWGAILLALGAVSAVAGALYALMQDDMKRLLACSTVENVGLIAVVLGLGVLFKADGQAGLAAIAVAAALLHVLNHSLFKPLLFYGAGAVLGATGSRSLNGLGGVLRRMPRTGWLTLVGVAGIAALPPLNGFASEWLAFQAVLAGPQLSVWGLKVATMVAAVALALAAALAAACFVRFYGIVFLGRPRSPEGDAGAAKACDPAQPILLAMAGPAALCLLIGLFPAVALSFLSGAVQLVAGAVPASPDGLGGWLRLAPTPSSAGAAGSDGSGFGGGGYGAVAILAAGLVLWALLRTLMRRLPDPGLRRVEAWGCGYPDPGPVAQYSGDSLAQPLRRIFARGPFHARETVTLPTPGDTAAARHDASWRDPAWDLLVTPAVAAPGWAADRVNRFQFLTVRRYLVLMFATLVTLLVLVAVLR